MWKTDPLLASLPHLYDLLTIAASSDIQGHSLNGTHNTLRHRKVDAVQSWIKDNERNSWEPPKLIVAVEFDYWGPHAVKTWTEIGYSRGFQIVQVSGNSSEVTVSLWKLMVPLKRHPVDNTRATRASRVSGCLGPDHTGRRKA